MMHQIPATVNSKFDGVRKTPTTDHNTLTAIAQRHRQNTQRLSDLGQKVLNLSASKKKRTSRTLIAAGGSHGGGVSSFGGAGG
eukprot:910191-Pyramimonas_sp.AAC.1